MLEADGGALPLCLELHPVPRTWERGREDGDTVVAPVRMGDKEQGTTGTG